MQSQQLLITDAPSADDDLADGIAGCGSRAYTILGQHVGLQTSKKAPVPVRYILGPEEVLSQIPGGASAETNQCKSLPVESINWG